MATRWLRSCFRAASWDAATAADEVCSSASRCAAEQRASTVDAVDLSHYVRLISSSELCNAHVARIDVAFYMRACRQMAVRLSGL